MGDIVAFPGVTLEGSNIRDCTECVHCRFFEGHAESCAVGESRILISWPERSPVACPRYEHDDEAIPF